MIVDFQHHYTPRELFNDELRDRTVLKYDENGAPFYISHPMLYDLDEHIRMMDIAGIDAAFLTSGSGMCVSPEPSRFMNDKMKEAERKYPGRFIGAAHIHPLGGAEAFRELSRCSAELGFPGVVITSEIEGLFLDDPRFDPFWAEASRLGMFVFVHPALKLNDSKQFDCYDTARSVGREFSLAMTIIRLINSGVFDRHPNLTVHMAHLGGGIASLLGRIRSYQDKDFWATVGDPRHGVLPERDFDFYLRERMFFDTAGFCGDIRSVNTALVELPASRIVFATDYPQEIRSPAVVRDFVHAIRELGSAGDQILSGNVPCLLNQASQLVNEMTGGAASV